MIVDLAFSLPIHQCFSYTSDQALLPGMRVQAPLGKRMATGIVVRLRTEGLPGVTLRPIHKVLDAEVLIPDSLMKLAQWMAQHYFSSYGEALFTISPSAINPRPLDISIKDSVSLCLTEAQAQIVQRIQTEDVPFWYLHGITGSGKTEVFLHLAEQMLAQGKAVIYLVPEIGLSYQLIESIGGRFRDQSAILHSRLTPAQRMGQWKDIQSGRRKLVVGTRSAVFAPVENLGLIIIDEEQDASYKEDTNPRYHARQVAMRRIRQEGGKLLMGSATPSLEAWYFMAQGTLTRLVLSKRVAEGRMPSLMLIDMRKEKMLLSATLLRELQDGKQKGSQSILFMNRRGYAHVYACRSCGEVLQCHRCAIPLVYHKSMEKMLCHYCGLTTVPPICCQECGSVDASYMGFGSQMVEQELSKLLPDCRIARLDSDTARKKGYLEGVLTEFRKGNIDILLGTQMIAKGLNFPGLQLVGIVLADTGLSIPDFRAQERVFSQIVQVAGRAGRYAPGGKVIIQTYRPQNPAIQYALHNQQEKFYHSELVTRRELQFPPYTRIIRLVFRGKNEAKVRQAANAFHQRIPRISAIEVRGPAACVLSRISNNYRRHILFISSHFSLLHETVGALLAAGKVVPSVYLEVDVDPLSII